MVIIFIWLGLCFLVAMVGTEKSIGYWAVFFLSLLFSPLIGLIIALVSSPKGGKTVSTRVMNLDLAKKSENRGDYQEAWKYYKDALYDFKNAGIAKDKHVKNYRTKKIIEIESKINEIESKL